MLKNIHKFTECNYASDWKCLLLRVLIVIFSVFPLFSNLQTYCCCLFSDCCGPNAAVAATALTFKQR